MSTSKKKKASKKAKRGSEKKQVVKKTVKKKKRGLIKELTALIESRGPDKVSFKECRKLARQIKPDTSYNETYHLILVGRVKSNLKKSTPKKKKKK